MQCRCSKFRTPRKRWSFFTDRLIVAGMLTIVSAIVSLVSFRFRRRASLELEVLALRHQVAVNAGPKLAKTLPRNAVQPIERVGIGESKRKFRVKLNKVVAMLAPGFGWNCETMQGE